MKYLCECNCTPERQSPKCSNVGTFKCGICECDEGHFGHICQCDASLVSKNDTSNCIDPKNPKKVCNGDGQCICGQCECLPQEVREKNKIYGEIGKDFFYISCACCFFCTDL